MTRPRGDVSSKAKSSRSCVKISFSSSFFFASFSNSITFILVLELGYRTAAAIEAVSGLSRAESRCLVVLKCPL